MGTKNNPKNRAKAKEKKKFNGREVEPILFHGVNAGFGKYIAARYAGSNEIVRDKAGKPLPWDNM